ncbi:hypothetical protein GCM10022220_19180 [Actinocatenispora rupis]|uniref:Uncharacterized protein n=1 Tax=Actinocatenispora rupis TaxID=519421 RepID=A0A8J3J6B3_9ACTN|nr:hypothetical protein Aru02nite_17580 [Actinocatenispora rupis]
MNASATHVMRFAGAGLGTAAGTVAVRLARRPSAGMSTAPMAPPQPGDVCTDGKPAPTPRGGGCRNIPREPVNGAVSAPSTVETHPGTPVPEVARAP